MSKELSRDNGDMSVSLTDLVKEGNDAAFSELLRHYEPLLRSLAGEFSSGGGSDTEDLMQELRIAFYSAAMKYNAGNGVSFGLYAKVCMRNAMISFGRKHSVEITPIDEIGDIEAEDDLVERLIEHERIGELQRIINGTLSDYEKEVWRSHLEGVQTREIAAKLGRNVKSIENALSRIKVKLRRVICTKK